MKNVVKTNEEYFDLVRRFPLRPIKRDQELREASEIFGSLGMKGIKLSIAEQDYLNVLGKLIYDYEERSPRIRSFMTKAKKISSREILKSFMEDHKLSQSELARRIKIPQSVISEFLYGKRGLSKKSIVKLGNYFAVSPELFLPRY